MVTLWLCYFSCHVYYDSCLFTITIVLRVFSLYRNAIWFARILVRSVTLILMLLYWCIFIIQLFFYLFYDSSSSSKKHCPDYNGVSSPIYLEPNYFMIISFKHKYNMFMFIIHAYLPIVWCNLWHYRCPDLETQIAKERQSWVTIRKKRKGDRVGFWWCYVDIGLRELRHVSMGSIFSGCTDLAGVYFGIVNLKYFCFMLLTLSL